MIQRKKTDDSVLGHIVAQNRRLGEAFVQKRTRLYRYRRS